MAKQALKQNQQPGISYHFPIPPLPFNLLVADQDSPCITSIQLLSSVICTPAYRILSKLLQYIICDHPSKPLMDYYRVLGVSGDATTEEITRHFKRLALRYHPDKNNHDPQLTEKFKEVSRAYEVLKDNRLRLIYDNKGEQGLREFQAPPPNAHFAAGALAFSAFAAGAAVGPQLFSKIFNDLNTMFECHLAASSDMKRKVEPLVEEEVREFTKGKDIHHTCTVELADLYYGKQIKLALPKQLRCDQCQGVGGTNPKTCRECHGLGRVVISHFNQFSQMRQVGLCRACMGRGVYIAPPNACEGCKGQGYLQQQKVLKVNLLPGSRNNDKIILRGEADEGPFIIPGDVIIHICERPHRFLVRRNNDLFMEKEIDLKTALMGGLIYVEDFVLDGQTLHIDVDQAMGPIQPGEPKVIRNCGMPINQATKGGIVEQNLDEVDFLKDAAFDMSKYPRGNLFINFLIKMPNMGQFSTEDAEVLLRLLGSLPSPPSNGSIVGSGTLANLDGNKRRRL